VSPKVFRVAPHFNPICFAQSPPLHTNIGGPKGETLHHPIESSILGSLHKLTFFCAGPIKLTHCKKKRKKKRVGLARHPRLINMKQNNRYPSSWEAVLAQAQNGDKQFLQIKVPCSQWKAQHGLMRGPVFFFWGRRGGGVFFFFPPCFHHVSYMFLWGSQRIPQVLNLFH
jgi:hypothetical protein